MSRRKHDRPADDTPAHDRTATPPEPEPQAESISPGPEPASEPPPPEPPPEPSEASRRLTPHQKHVLESAGINVEALNGLEWAHLVVVCEAVLAVLHCKAPVKR